MRSSGRMLAGVQKQFQETNWHAWFTYIIIAFSEVNTILMTNTPH